MLPLIIQIERTDEHEADTVAFNKSPVRIGRNPLNDLPLEEGFVSQWHGVVRFNAERTSILDLGSTNRITVDGARIERNVEVPVDHTSDVRIGSLRLHLLRVEAPSELFDRRRSRSAFARVGNPEQGDVTRTMFFADGAALPSPAALQAMLPSGLRNPQITPSSAQPIGVVGIVDSSARPAAVAHGLATPPQGQGDASLPDAYRAYRNAWGAFFASVRSRLQALPKEQREAELFNLQRQYPQLAAEPDLQTYLKELGIDPLKAGQPQMEDWLRRLTNDLFPPPGGSVNIALAMERVGELLEVFAQAFIVLRNSQSDFCREMSLERYAESSTLQTGTDPHVLLAYLLTPTQEGASRPNELSRALADHALHQVALVSAVVEGARTLLENLSPNGVKAAKEPSPQMLAHIEESMGERLWPHAARKMWRRFSAMHRDLWESDRFTRDLFGRSFARRYYSITGGNEPP